MKNIKYYFLTFILLFSELLVAEDMQMLSVTTGTRTSKLVSEAPIKTEVVTKEDIAKTHAKNVSEALKYVPGVVIKETHGKQGSSVWIQGFNSDRVLILLDGEPMTSATGQTVNLNQLDVSDIESIEIIKGAASALYGSQAMGGVINIKTRRAKKGFHSQGLIELGTYGNKSAKNIPVSQLKASATYKNDSYETSLYTDYRYDSGIKLQEGYEYDLPQTSQININGVFRTLGKHQFYIKPRIYIENATKPFSSFAPGISAIEEEKKENIQKYRLSVGSDSTFDNGDKLKSSVFAERYISDSFQSKIITPYTELTRNAVIDMAQADVQYDRAFGESHIVTTGMQLRYQALEQEQTTQTASSSVTTSELGDDASSYAIEGYAQDDYVLNEDLELIPGVRYQYDSDFGSYVSPKISLFYTPYIQGKDRFNIRTSYGNGYRAPSIKERYFTFDHSYLGYMVLGNPDLVPESSHSYQLSFEWIDASMFNINVNFYYNDITNLIDTQKNIIKSIETGLEIHEYKNVSSALTYGTELQTSKKFLDIWTLSGGYTYLYSEDTDTKKQLTQRPEHQVKATLSLDVKKTSAQVSVVYESEEYVDSDNLLISPASTQVDIKMTQQVTKLFSIYGGVNNLLDEHEDPQDPHDLRTKRPRYAYIGAKYQF